MNNNYHFIDLCRLSRKVPDALALIGGSEKYPSIRGRVRFYQTFSGVIVLSEITGLPQSNEPCKSLVFAFHIHSGSLCKGNADDKLSLDFHYCPLVKGWQKMGCTDEEIAVLCDITMCGDHGIGEQYDAVLDLPKCIAKGDDICALRYHKK